MNGTVVKSSELNNGTYVISSILNNGSYLNSASYNDAWINETIYNKTQVNEINASMNNTLKYYIPYQDANKNFNLGNNNLTINGTLLFVNTNNTRIGIGTITPQNILNVLGDGNFTGTLYALGVNLSVNNESVVNWIANTFNTTRNNEVARQNTSMKNYVGEVNASVTNALATKLNLAGGNMTGNINMTSNSNITMGERQKTCYTYDCSKYMMYNGTALIIQG